MADHPMGPYVEKVAEAIHEFYSATKDLPDAERQQHHENLNKMFEGISTGGNCATCCATYYTVGSGEYNQCMVNCNAQNGIAPCGTI
ncbi:MAG: hypothetical protein ACLQVD_14570 [Capsulimonadaceae bacterium]